MLKTTKPFVSLFIVSLLFFTLVPFVRAENNTTPARTYEEREAYKEEMRLKKEEALENREQKQEALQERKEERTEKLCENVTKNIENRLAAFDNHKATRIAHYEKLVSKLTEIASKLADKGYDVTELQASIAELEVMIDDYIALYEDFIAQLRETQALACGDSDGAFRDALQEAKAAWELVKEKRQEIREFYSNEIRNVIKDLRDQARELEVTNE